MSVVTIREILVCRIPTAAVEAEKIAEELKDFFGSRANVELRDDCDVSDYQHVTIIADGVKITNLSSKRLQTQFLSDPMRAVDMAKRVNEVRTQELDHYLNQDFIL